MSSIGGTKAQLQAYLEYVEWVNNKGRKKGKWEHREYNQVEFLNLIKDYGDKVIRHFDLSIEQHFIKIDTFKTLRSYMDLSNRIMSQFQDQEWPL